MEKVIIVVVYYESMKRKLIKVEKRKLPGRHVSGNPLYFFWIFSSSEVRAKFRGRQVLA
jgi:hypothetical protein